MTYENMDIIWRSATVQPCILFTIKYYKELKFSMSCVTYKCNFSVFRFQLQHSKTL